MITLIIPCLNERANINLIKQNIGMFNNCKHIIVDGSSRDVSRAAFKKKIKFHCNQPSRGLQLRKGAEASNTKWLLFLHADTKLNKKNISDIYSFMLIKNTLK